MKATPSLSVPAVDERGLFTDAWGSFVQGLVQPPGAIRGATVSGSPFTYIARGDGRVAIAGGAVTSVSLTRGRVSIPTGQTRGFFPVSDGDTLIVTYTAVPTMSFIPG